MLEVMNGDDQAALHAIAEAERVGVEPGWLNLLRSSIEQNRGRVKEAIIYLEQTEKQLPDGVAVKALLAQAYMADGQWERYSETYSRLEGLEPRTDEDYVFLSMAMINMDPARAVQTLDKAPIRTQESLAGRSARFFAQGLLAMMTGRVEDAQKALEASQKIGVLDKPLLLAVRLEMYLILANTYGPQDPRRVDALELASGDYDRLGNSRDNPWVVTARCRNHFVRGEYDALLDEARRARDAGVETPYLVDMEVSVLYGRKQYDEALRVIRRSDRFIGENQKHSLMGIVLAAVPGRREEAEREFREAIHRCQGGIELSYIAADLQLLGPDYRVRARQAALEIRERLSHRIPNARGGWYHELLAFHTGLLDADQLLEKAGELRSNQCEAHYYIGLRKLAEGKRTEAKACFTRSFGTNVYIFPECCWSRAFLARIDDPAWLPWIPAKKK
jgi:tetratricopeptide (TPR) repeat protein